MSATHPETITISVSESIGTVTGLLLLPEHPKAVLVLAHGAGAGMQHSFMEKIALQLAEVGIGTLRYNFPFTENKKKRPDVAAVAEKTVGAALTKAFELFPNLPVFAAGKSFGGRMSSRFLSGKSDVGIRGVIFYGFPLHPAGAPATERAEHLAQVTVPMLFLQGTKDALAELSLITQVCAKLPSATLVTFDGADHSFKKGKKEFIEELVTATTNWLKEKL